MKRRRRVLIIDDDPTMERILRRALNPRHYEVYSAPNGREGLAMAWSHRPHLIVLDLIMPDMDGHAVCHHLGDDPARRLPTEKGFSFLQETPLHVDDQYDVGHGRHLPYSYYTSFVIAGQQ